MKKRNGECGEGIDSQAGEIYKDNKGKVTVWKKRKREMENVRKA